MGLAVVVVIVVPVKEHDDVGILLDGARFPQVGEHGPLIGAGLVGTGELAQAEHRDIQLFRHELQAPGDVGDDLLAVLPSPALPSGGLHQL